MAEQELGPLPLDMRAQQVDQNSTFHSNGIDLTRRVCALVLTGVR